MDNFERFPQAPELHAPLGYVIINSSTNEGEKMDSHLEMDYEDRYSYEEDEMSGGYCSVCYNGDPFCECEDWEA